MSQAIDTLTADFHQWRKSLRSLSPSGRAPLVLSQSFTPSSSARRQMCDLRQHCPSPSQASVVKNEKGNCLTGTRRSHPKKPMAVDQLRRSTGNMAEHASSAVKAGKSLSDVSGHLEAEYIHNLQRQVFFLELEANYLRQQLSTATNLYPQIVQEADRMMLKLKTASQERDAMTAEMKRKESGMGVMQAEKQRLVEQIRDVSDLRAKDKRLLMDEVVTLKTEKDRIDRELGRKEDDLKVAKASVDERSLALNNADTRIQTLKAQLEQRAEQHSLTQLALEEKRSELVSVETQLRELEEKYYRGSIQVHEEMVEDLRNEMRSMGERVKEAEMSADKDRYVRDKLDEDVARLVRDNARLGQQVVEMKNQLRRESEFGEDRGHRHARSVSEVAELRDKTCSLQLELDKVNVQVKREQEQRKQLLEQLTAKDVAFCNAEHGRDSAQSRVADLKSLLQSSEAEVAQLKHDKLLMVEHMAELQRKVDERERKVMELQVNVASMNSTMRRSEDEKSLQMSAQSKKWEEFRQLAENMRLLSSSMAITSVTAGSSQP